MYYMVVEAINMNSKRDERTNDFDKFIKTLESLSEKEVDILKKAL